MNDLEPPSSSRGGSFKTLLFQKKIIYRGRAETLYIDTVLIAELFMAARVSLQREKMVCLIYMLSSCCYLEMQCGDISYIYKSFIVEYKCVLNDSEEGKVV